MRVFCACIVTRNLDLAERWGELLKNSGANTKCIASIADLSMVAPVCGRGLALLDIENDRECCPSGILKFCEAHPGISIVLFGKSAKVSDRDIAAFLEAGADDFIPEEIDERVLLAKLRAYVRRSHPRLDSVSSLLVSKKKYIKADRASRLVSVKDPAGKWVELPGFTAREFDLLCAFLFNCGRVMCRSYLMDMVWGDEAQSVNSETVDKNVESIRRKLGRYGAGIHTVYGSGYMFKEN